LGLGRAETGPGYRVRVEAVVENPVDTSECAIGQQGCWPLVTAAEMQALDRRTIDEGGVPGAVLMENAGRSLIRPALELRASSSRSNDPIRALCGGGNNGGDGFVLARHLHLEGISTEALLVGDPRRLPRDAALNWALLETLAVPRRVVEPNDDAFDWAGLLAATSVGVDALFGTGLKREIQGGWARLVAAVTAARRDGLRVLSVDIPSGVAANTGGILGEAIVADRTVTISLPKVGLALEPGASHGGRVDVARIGIMDPDPERRPSAELWNVLGAAARFPERPRTGHKGRFGHVLVMAGSTGMTGASVLASRATLRAGAGLVTLAHPAGLDAELGGLPAEVMTAPVAATPDGGFARSGEKAVEELVSSRDVVALGPGLGRGAEVVDLVRRLIRVVERPLVVDADGLNALTGQLPRLREREQPTVLTPHPGEAARLLDTTAGEVNADRLGAARALSAESGATVVLKGARTVVAEPLGRALVVSTGGPQLATAGTGDVLTGVVAALLAAELGAFDAAGLAAWWHGAAADRWAAGRGELGLLASELADALPETAHWIRLEAEAVRSRREPGEILELRFPGP